MAGRQDRLGELRRAARGAALAEIFAEMSRLPLLMIEERMVQTRMLTLGETPTPQNREATTAARRLFDEGAARSRLRIDAAGTAAPAPVIDALRSLAEAVGAMRRDVDATARRPLAERLTTQPGISARGIAAQRELGTALAGLEQDIARLSSGLGHPAVMARLVLQLRQAASGAVSAASPALRQNRFPTAEELRRYDRAVGRTESLEGRLEAQVTGQASTPALRGDIDAFLGRIRAA